MRISVRYGIPAFVSLVLTVSSAWPQEPPKITSGYATEGRPGFVSMYSEEGLSWKPLTIPGMPLGSEAKLLSQDDKLGALSLLSYLPIGSRTEARGYRNADEEIFLLEGDLTIGDQQMTKYSYAFIPAGVVRGPSSTRQGAVFLQWFNKTPDFVESDRDKLGARGYAAVKDWNFFERPWSTDTFPVYRKGPPITGIRLKLLRHDPDTSEMTWISFSVGGGPASWAGSLWEMHPTFEEYYLIEMTKELTVGECLPGGPTPVTFGPRGYWFRPAGIGHIGPLRRLEGYGLFIVRTGGPLWADYYNDCTYKHPIDLSNPKDYPESDKK